MLLTASALAALTLPAPQLQPRFAAQQLAYHFPTTTSGSVTDLVVGDLNNDGRDDVVVPGNGVQAFLAYASGGLRGPMSSDPLDMEDSLALGDLDEDGSLDLVAQVDGQIVWMAGDGAGRFGAPQLVGPAIQWPDFEVLDLDLDGHLDVLAVSGSALQVHLGDGTGQFTPQAVVAIQGDWARDFATGDVDGDGLPDVVLLFDVFQSQLATLVNLGGGLLAPAATIQAPFSSVRELQLGDLDLDGDLDLVAGSDYDYAVFLGNGDGTFGAGAETSNPASGSLLLCDWDGDARLDLVLGDIGNSEYVLRWAAGDGLGGFGVPEQLPASTDASPRAAADVNGDGRIDLVVGHAAPYFGLQGGSSDLFTKVTVLLGDGAGGVRARRETPLPNPESWKVLGDANGDGIVDLARPQGPVVELRLGNGGGLFGAPIAVALPVGVNTVLLGDVDGDGLDDLVGVDTFDMPHDVVTLKGDGQGNFTGAVTGTVPGSGPVELVDFDGDGRMDLAACGSGQFFLALGQQDGSFVAQPPVAGFATTDLADHYADLDGDGNMDVLTGPVNAPMSGSSNYGVAFGDGNGGLLAVENRSVPYTVHSSTLWDFDGDGDPDLAFGREQDFIFTFYDIGLLRNDGSGQFGEGRLIDVGAKPDVFGTADLDGDGREDLITWTDAGSLVWLSIGKPKHVLLQDSIASHRHHGIGFDTPIGVGDANADGRLDVIIATDQGVATYLNLGN